MLEINIHFSYIDIHTNMHSNRYLVMEERAKAIAKKAPTFAKRHVIRFSWKLVIIISVSLCFSEPSLAVRFLLLYSVTSQKISNFS